MRVWPDGVLAANTPRPPAGRGRSIAAAILALAVAAGFLPAASASPAAPASVLLTLAGTGESRFGGDGAPAREAPVHAPEGVATDSSGNVYVADTFNQRIRKVDASGSITTVAGNGSDGFSGDGGPATEAQLNHPTGVAVDDDGSLYIADRSNHRVRRVDPSGIITTVAGTGTAGYLGDEGPATEAYLYYPQAVAVDSADGSLYVADSVNNVVRRVDPSGTITTFAGTGMAGSAGDGGPATEAELYFPLGVALDPVGDLYIADTLNDRIRKVDDSGTITTVAGSTHGFGGDGGPAIEAQLRFPYGVAVDSAGLVWIADTFNHRIRRVDASGTIATAAGSGIAGTFGGGFNGDGRPADRALLHHPTGVAFGDGALYLADTTNNRVRRVGPDLLFVTIEDEPDPVAGGRPLVYTVRIRNLAPAPATGVALTSVLPGGASLRSATPSQGGCFHSGGTVSCSLGTLAAGAAAVLRMRLRAPVLATSQQPVSATNSVRAWANETDPFVLDDAARARTTVMVPADLSVTLDDAPDPVGVLQPITYTFEVTNGGPGNAVDVRADQVLPAGATSTTGEASQGFCAALFQPEAEATTLRCHFGDLPPGATATAMVRALAPAHSGEVESAVTVASFTPEVEPANDVDTAGTTVSTIVVPGELGVANEESADPVTAGEPLEYALTVANGRATEVTGVTLTDVVPPGVTFASVSSSQGGCEREGEGPVTCALGTLAPGARATVTIVVTPEAATPALTNTATVASNETAPASAVATTVVSGAGCGRVVMESTTLEADVGPCAGPGIVVGADGITLDLGGHHVYGFPGDGGGSQGGIVLPMRTGATVRNGTVSDFDAGVVVYGRGGNTVTELQVRDNIGPPTLVGPDLGDGIFVANSAGNLIEGNTVSRNGNYDGIGVLGSHADRNVIRDNVVEGSVTDPSPPWVPNGQGIIVNAVLDAHLDRGRTIWGTTVEGNAVRHNAFSGISNVNSIMGRIAGNTVEGNGARGVGNGIGVQLGPDVLSRVARMLIEGNAVHHNAGDGVQISGSVHGNHIVGNDAADNGLGVLGVEDLQPRFDLHDLNPNCQTNVWSGNTWGLGGYSPGCTAAGGSGPSVGPPAAGVTPFVLEAPQTRPRLLVPTPGDSLPAG